MTNDAIVTLFDHLCNEARNAVHATFGLMEFPAEKASGPAWQTCLDATRTNADRLLRTIDDMRELLAGEPAIEGTTEEFDVSVSLGETVELLNLAGVEGPIRIVFDSRPAPIMISQNRSAVEQVFTRILHTCFRLSRRGTVRVSVAPSSGDRISVGIMPPSTDVAGRLVDWLNANTDLVKFENDDEVGLGLSIMVAGRRLQALGGTAEFKSEPGAPTGLELTFPSYSQHAPDPPNWDHTPARALNILVAEDCDESYALTALLLPNENVERARNGLEAIDMVKQRRYDAVFMDIHMPGMNGYGAISNIREWETQTCNARTPIVVLSSDDLTKQSRNAAQAGCSAFLRKPVRKPDLFDFLDRLRSARMMQV
jgi:CheY-like chemotaxis protein